MVELEAQHTTTVIVGSPYIEDFKLLCDTFDPADTLGDLCEDQWTFERHGACLHLGKNAHHTLLNGALAYLRNLGFEPDPTEDLESFPEPYPPDSADQGCPNTSTYVSFGPGTRNRQGELLSWADCDLISRTQRLVEDLHAETSAPNVTIAWIFGDTTPVVPVSEGNWIIGGDVTWAQSFDDISLEEVKQTIAQLRATADHLPVLSPLAADKSYYPLGLHEQELVWHALELTPLPC